MAQIFKNLQVQVKPAAISVEPTPASLQANEARAAEAEIISAEKSAREQLEIMRRELDSLKSKARQEGFQAGYDEGLSAAEAKLSLEMARVDRVLKDLNLKMMMPLVEQEAALLEIVLTGIARLVGQALTDKEVAIQVVRQALAEYGDKLVSSLYLSNEDYEYLTENGIQFDAYPGLRIAASPKINNGGCLIETANGFIDARIETQLERILAVLQHARVNDTGKPRGG